MKLDFINKIKRILKLIFLLQEKEYTISELANFTDVSKRTIQRDIYDIQWDLGFKVERIGAYNKEAYYKIIGGKK